MNNPNAPQLQQKKGEAINVSIVEPRGNTPGGIESRVLREKKSVYEKRTWGKGDTASQIGNKIEECSRVPSSTSDK